MSANDTHHEQIEQVEIEELSLYEQIKRGHLEVNNLSPAEWRFWRWVDKNGPLHLVLRTNCWVWNGHKSPRKYGVIRAHGKIMRAHRLSWKLHIGSIPEGLCVLHHCDNPSCVNPEHLFLGTHQDNRDDCVKKSRQARGESSGVSKLTEEQVREIRTAYVFGKRGYGAVVLSIKYKVSLYLIQQIVRGRAWKHVK